MPSTHRNSTRSLRPTLAAGGDALMQSLEARRLFAVDSLSADGILTLTGTETADVIQVYPIKDHLAVRFGGDVVAAYKRSLVSQIVIFGGSGNDILASSVNTPTIMFGGDGNDRLTSGNANDTLVGGRGRDILSGRGGNDILRGDTGNDELYGGLGDDVIYAGPDELTSGRPARNVTDGGKGSDTLIPSANSDDRVRRGIEVVAGSESFRPAGRAFPESFSTLNPVFLAPVVAGRDALLTVNYTLPNATSRVLFATAARRRGADFRFSVLPLITPDAGTSNTVGTSVEVIGMPVGSRLVSFVAPEGRLGDLTVTVAPPAAT